MTDYIEVLPDGGITLKLDELTQDQWAAVSKLKITDSTTGSGDNKESIRKIEFELADADRSLNMLAKHLGMFTQKIEINDTTPTVEEAISRLQRALGPQAN